MENVKWVLDFKKRYGYFWVHGSTLHDVIYELCEEITRLGKEVERLSEANSET